MTGLCFSRGSVIIKPLVLISYLNCQECLIIGCTFVCKQRVQAEVTMTFMKTNEREGKAG